MHGKGALETIKYESYRGHSQKCKTSENIPLEDLWGERKDFKSLQNIVLSAKINLNNNYKWCKLLDCITINEEMGKEKTVGNEIVPLFSWHMGKNPDIACVNLLKE